MMEKRIMEKHKQLLKSFFPSQIIIVCGFYQSCQESVLLGLSVVLRLSEQALQPHLFAVLISQIFVSRHDCLEQRDLLKNLLINRL